MFLTLTAPDAAPALKAWLTRQGFASRSLQGGTALLIDDPWVPGAIKAALALRPEVSSLEETHDLPRLALGAGPTPPAFQVGPLPLIAGPCALESLDHALETADFLADLGVLWLRGGTNKTRTRPDSFQGAGVRAAHWLREAADRYGLRCVSEVTEGNDLEAIGELLDLVQVGARNMHAPRFLRRVGQLGKPVLLKRGFAAEPAEWLWAAEYLLEAGAPSIIFCERGLRTAAPLKRFTLDLGAVPFVRSMTPFPIWVDPSHAAGSTPYVAPLARAAIAAGADAVIVECHPAPERACSDATQALDFDALAALAADLRRLASPAPEKAGMR
jgi:3-deoxy-7-phosphoheptulonate synthase